MSPEEIQGLKEELIAIYRWGKRSTEGDCDADPTGRAARLMRVWEIVAELSRASAKQTNGKKL